MSRLPLRSIDDAPEASRVALETAERNNGYLPNLLRVLANAPAALEAYLTLSGINAKASLSLREREIVQITAATTHGCGFCVAGHTAIALKKAGLDQRLVDDARNNQPLSDPRLNAVAVFTRAVIAARGAVPDNALIAFKDAGFDNGATLEVVLGVSLATLCNFANNLGRPVLNPELEPFRWDGLAQSSGKTVAAE